MKSASVRDLLFPTTIAWKTYVIVIVASLVPALLAVALGGRDLAQARPEGYERELSSVCRLLDAELESRHGSFAHLLETEGALAAPREKRMLHRTMKQELLDVKFMSEAMAQAHEASLAGEVPVGAVVVMGDEVIARARNRKESDKDPTAHAEILAIREAANRIGSWRLSGATIYVTLEPCPMCAGAIVQARLDRLVYGAADPKTGAAGTIFDLPRDMRLNHWVSVTGGVMAEEAGALLEKFFSNKR